MSTVNCVHAHAKAPSSSSALTLPLPASVLVVYVQVALKIAIVPIVKSPTFTLAFNLTMFVAIHAAFAVSQAAASVSPNVVYATAIKEQVRYTRETVSCDV